MPVFAALFIVYVDCAARAAHRTAAKETPCSGPGSCWMALAAAYPLYGYQPGPLGDWQWMGHTGQILFAVWYWCWARCGMLAQGQSWAVWPPGTRWPDSTSCRSGISFCGRVTVFAALRTHLQDRTRQHEKFLHLIVTAAVTRWRCAVLAWGPPAAADANFAALGQQVSDWCGQAAEQCEIH